MRTTTDPDSKRHAHPSGRTAPDRPALKAVALTVTAFLFAGLLAETGIRVAFPPHRFLDPQQDCFWATRLQHELERAGEEQLYGSGRYDSRMGWLPQPNLRRPGLHTNARGLRGKREYVYAKPEGVTRLVVHGDSFTWGLGVRDSETYSARLADGIPSSEVLNLGVNGHGIDQQYLYWLDEGRRYGPDVVILGFYVPDVHRNALAVRELPKPRFILEGGQLSPVQIPVPGPRAFLEAWGADCGSPSRLIDLASAVRRRLDLHEAEHSLAEKLALTRALLVAWHESARESGAALCVVIIPHARSGAYPDHLRIERFIERTAADGGFACLNLTEPMRSFEESGEKPYLARNGHWSAAGHAHAAREIASFFETSPLGRFARQRTRRVL